MNVSEDLVNEKAGRGAIVQTRYVGESHTDSTSILVSFLYTSLC